MAQYSNNLIGMNLGGYGTQATRMSALSRMADNPFGGSSGVGNVSNGFGEFGGPENRRIKPSMPERPLPLAMRDTSTTSGSNLVRNVRSVGEMIGRAPGSRTSTMPQQIRYNGVLLPSDPRNLPRYTVPGRENRAGGFMGTGADMIREAEDKWKRKEMERDMARVKLAAYKDTSNPYYGYLQRNAQRLERETQGMDSARAALRERYKNPDEKFYYGNEKLY